MAKSVPRPAKLYLRSMTDTNDDWLSEDPLPADPLPIAQRWLDEAFAAREQPNPHAIALATVDPEGHPAARMVLCKAIETDPGGLVFYTDRSSRKGRALAHQPRAEACFHFAPQGRQVRMAGAVSLTTDAESDAYFATRPLDSQLGAWASRQSEPLASREALLAAIAEAATRFGVAPGGDQPSDQVPRPPDWGGYRLVATRVELWHSRPGRAHDRAAWTREDPGQPWTVTRLNP